jgi:hypothetical protein
MNDLMHELIDSQVDGDQEEGDHAAQKGGGPKEEFLPPYSQVIEDGLYPVEDMKGEEDHDEEIHHRLAVKEDRPIRLLLLGVEIKAAEDFDAEQDDQGKTADSME